jgi:hypothetical protein
VLGEGGIGMQDGKTFHHEPGGMDTECEMGQDHNDRFDPQEGGWQVAGTNSVRWCKSRQDAGRFVAEDVGEKND